jgi:hypothetical protein
MSSRFKNDEMMNPSALQEYQYADPITARPGPRKVVDEGLEKLTYYLDQFFRIPGTKIRFGLDPIIGFLFPVAGDTLSTFMSIYIVLRSIRYGLPKIVIGRMMFNVAIDYLIGSISFVGDLFDFAFKANNKNLKLLERFATGEGRAHWTDWLWVFMLIGLFVGAIALWLWFIYWVISSFKPIV